MTAIYLIVFIPLSFYLVLIFWMSRVLPSDRVVTEGNPQFKEANKLMTILVPFKNEENQLKNLIRGLSSQSLGSDQFQIYFIDDHSSDGSRQVIQEASKSLACANLLITSNGVGKKAALTTGIETSNSEYIVTIDADCVVSGNWLLAVAEHISLHKSKMIIGPVAPLTNSSWISKVFALDFISLLASTASFALRGVPILCNGANLVFSKEAFHLVDGYQGNSEVNSGDDVFLLHKFKKAFQDDSISYLDDKRAIVRTRVPNSWKEFITQRLRWIGKSGSYMDPMTICVSLFIFLIYLLELVLFLHLIWTKEWYYFAIYFFLKLGIDFLFLRKANTFFEVPNVIGNALPVALLQIFYLPLLIIAALAMGKGSSGLKSKEK